MFKDIHEDYLRSIVFGFQDALVSTTGVIVGVAIGSQNKSIVILAGVITIMVEALSMGAGQYLSEKSVHELDKAGAHTDSLITGGLLMWLSYTLGGSVPLLPIFFLDITIAPRVSIAFALAGLFILGFLKGKLVNVSPIRSAFEMFILGGFTTAVGLLVGSFLNID